MSAVTWKALQENVAIPIRVNYSSKSQFSKKFINFMQIKQSPIVLLNEQIRNINLGSVSYSNS
jgi:hypothetical protein